MTYGQALKQWSMAMMLAWARLPAGVMDLSKRAYQALLSFLKLALLIIAPLFILLAPLGALLVIADHKQTAKSIQRARRELDSHYGSRRQRL